MIYISCQLNKPPTYDTILIVGGLFMKKKKCITNIVESIEDVFIGDPEEFAKKFKHLIEGICKIDGLGRILQQKPESGDKTEKKSDLNRSDFYDKLDLEKWNDDVYDFFKKEILELTKKYSFDILDKSIPSRKTEIRSNKLYPSDPKGMMLIMNLRLLLFEIAARLNENIKDRDYYNQLYNIRYNYYNHFFKIYDKEIEATAKEYKKQNKPNEKIDTPYNKRGELLKCFLTIRENYFEEFLKISLKTNEPCFPYDLDYSEGELYYECKSEYLRNPSKDLDDLIHKCRQRLINRDL